MTSPTRPIRRTRAIRADKGDEADKGDKVDKGDKPGDGDDPACQGEESAATTRRPMTITRRAKGKKHTARRGDDDDVGCRGDRASARTKPSQLLEASQRSANRVGGPTRRRHGSVTTRSLKFNVASVPSISSRRVTANSPVPEVSAVEVRRYPFALERSAQSIAGRVIGLVGDYLDETAVAEPAPHRCSRGITKFAVNENRWCTARASAIACPSAARTPARR